ncbi:OLC1v1012419C1 [Oldenlandia corymbosa var. corymbosa]|uniref:OLC1v1012419C1 n=1 Tax=Oldenlandia corymbosa var. corymbosa TaxID=529605 RepID=A0AAV1DZE5_OLDCO|nr:OLC1v1012419C1 [Oldenlandia corymbosa var. corymbosa]
MPPRAHGPQDRRRNEPTLCEEVIIQLKSGMNKILMLVILMLSTYPEDFDALAVISTILQSVRMAALMEKIEMSPEVYDYVKSTAQVFNVACLMQRTAFYEGSVTAIFQPASNLFYFIFIAVFFLFVL